MEVEAATKRTRGTIGRSSVDDEPDRLSALPDCLLHAIMSFMKARQVVQTCVLSKRWKDVWHSAPCLDIDLDEFKPGPGPALAHYVPHNDSGWEDFEDFTINLMLRRNVFLLDSFRLNVPRSKTPQSCRLHTGSWLRRAMRYNVSYPSIQREERLSSNSWRLKRLYLCGIFLDDRFSKHVSLVCNSLEDLELKDCRCEFQAITSHSLKNLVLKDCLCGSNTDTSLVITAPSLAYLHLVRLDFFSAGISINEMRSLYKASIHLHDRTDFVMESKLRQHQFKLLCSLSNVTHLELSDLETMVLIEESTTFEQFKNLRSLLLENCDLSDHSQTLALFLQNSPNLEKLTLRQCKFTNGSKRRKGMPKLNKASCSHYHSLDVQCVNLKLTEIIYKDDDVRQLVELLLRISGNLPINQIKLRKID